PTGSSIFSRSSVTTTAYMTAPPIPPMMIASVGVTTAQGAVIATSPASAPFRLQLNCGLPVRYQPIDAAANAPAHAAKLVLSVTSEILGASVLSWLPGLKPN